MRRPQRGYADDMNELLWIPERSRSSLAVMKSLCDHAFQDGFTTLGVGLVVAESGTPADRVAAIVMELERVGLLACRRNGAGEPVVEPSQVMYALVRWLEYSVRPMAA